MQTVVISLGGSLIVPDKIDFNFLTKFKNAIRPFYKTHRFAIVCGGGAIARKYIQALKEENKSEKELSLAGIRATRMNAQFMMQFFGKEANETLPMNMEEVQERLEKNKVVFCGALRFSEKSTSDTTAAKLANHLKTSFINMTNVKGLYTSNPKINKDAKFIPKQTWKEFEKRAKAIKYSSGQHFVLDQGASEIIRKDKIKTYIIGKDLSNLKKILKNKPFTGTTIQG